MTKSSRVCVGLLLVAALPLAASLLAQDRPPGFQGPPQRPPGQQRPPSQQRPGQQAPRDQQGPPAQRGAPGFQPPRGPFGLGPQVEPIAAMLLMQEVQRELKLNEEQIAVARQLQRDWDAALNDAMPNLRPPGGNRGGDRGGNRGADVAEFQRIFAQMREDLDEVNQQAEKRIASILNEDQQLRFQQLALQHGGPEVLLRESVSSELKLTEEQAAAIQDLTNGGFGPGSPRIVEDPKAEALANLNAEQKAAWEELRGAPFEFPQDRGLRQGQRGGRGRGGPNREERKIVDQYDANADGWLNAEERQAARESMANAPQQGRAGGRRGGFGRGGREPGTPGPKVSPSDVETFAEADLYEHSVLRTLFLEFENTDWEEELEAFHDTDVEVPATLMVDGQTLENVGVHFRGMSSYMGVPRGSKRSFNVKVDFVNEDQRLYGYKTLNLLNLNGDPSFLSSVLYSHIARQYIAAPQANLVKVVVNGESWGVFANVQQYDKVFIKESFGMSGTRWKVQGSPGGRGGLEYIGDNVEDYKRIYTMKSNDGPEAWTSLINLCRVLNETPPAELEAALEPIMDVDQVLWFLALDNATSNSDGFWTRASDYYLFLGEDGKFRLIPHDMNEAFHHARGARRGGFDRGGPEGRGGPENGRGGQRGADFARGDGRAETFTQGREQGQERGANQGRVDLGRADQGRADQRRGQGQERRGGGTQPPAGGPQRGGFGRGGGRGGGGPELDPLVAANDPAKALCYRLFAVPELRAQYLECIQQIARDSMDWKRLRPVIEDYRQLVDAEIQADTRKLTSYEAFVAALADENVGAEGAAGLKSFFEQRRKFLLNYKESSTGN